MLEKSQFFRPMTKGFMLRSARLLESSSLPSSRYDSTVYPPLETVPRRFAISHRNRWMVETSDVVVAYVLHDWGGAAATLRCARKKKKQIISYFDEVDS